MKAGGKVARWVSWQVFGILSLAMPLRHPKALTKSPCRFLLSDGVRYVVITVQNSVFYNKMTLSEFSDIVVITVQNSVFYNPSLTRSSH